MIMQMTDDELIRAAMRLLGKRTSERKKASSRANAKRPRKGVNGAHQMVRFAIREGRLKPKPCERCGNPNVVAHHEDYNKPLDVTWLCRSCHKNRHNEPLAILMPNGEIHEK